MGKLFLTTGDYIKNAKGMDAIVDAQNKYMGVGGNICGLILAHAGRKELLDYCKENYKENMYPSEVRVTPGFNLNMDIIHVLAPIYGEEKEPIEILKKTYINLLETIKENDYKKVMICGLGTGSHGYNSNEIASDVIKILKKFIDENDVELYFNSMYPLYKEPYLTELLKLYNIDLSNIDTKTNVEIKNIILKYNLGDLYIKDKYMNFIKDRNFDDLCLSEKLLYFQYNMK